MNTAEKRKLGMVIEQIIRNEAKQCTWRKLVADLNGLSADCGLSFLTYKTNTKFESNQ